MRSLLTTCAALGVILSTGCHGALNGGNPLAEIDLTSGPAWLGEFNESGTVMYKAAFDTIGASFAVTSATVFDGLGIEATHGTSWMSVSTPVEEIAIFGAGDYETEGMVITLKPNTSAQSIVIGNFRDASNPDCIDYDEDGVEDDGEFWKDEGCWYRMNNYLTSDWIVPDVSDELGLQGAQFSAIVEQGYGLYPAETSI